VEKEDNIMVLGKEGVTLQAEIEKKGDIMEVVNVCEIVG